MTPVRHHQQISPSGEVYSHQALTLPRPATARLHQGAGDLYWAFLRTFGRGLLTIDQGPDGAVAICLPGRLLLLAFHAPALVPLGAGGVALRYPIAHGLAVHPAHQNQGYLQMGVAADEVSLTVEGYYPNLIRLHTRIYEWTQSALHLRVARGYLPLLADWLLREANEP